MLDMGEPVRIVDLARDLIALSGLEVGRDIDIVFTGVRPGEKLFEELFVTGDDNQPTAHEKIFIANNASRQAPDGLDQAIDELAVVAARGEATAIVRGLQELIPEFHPPEQAIPVSQPYPPLPAPTPSTAQPTGPVRFPTATSQASAR